ncbi:hypothetical protein [Lysinibacillus xylanilyticus]|uniref:hypothetical protein n=2 Tax=Lysinibacillus TaxID=400634 RepID=UPI00083C984D|nr:hypothetical protein [Lysinibacillus xylanilyticus]
MQQMFSVRKRSVNAATAANVFCAKAQCKGSDSSKCFLCESVVQRQRQQQMSSVRKRSANAATAANVFCAKA